MGRRPAKRSWTVAGSEGCVTATPEREEPELGGGLWEAQVSKLHQCPGHQTKRGHWKGREGGDRRQEDQKGWSVGPACVALV